MLQTLEAIIIKNFMQRLTVHAASANLDYELVTTMHDEVQFLVDDDDVVDFKMYAETAIKEVNAKFELTCPQDIDIHVGSTWAECH